MIGLLRMLGFGENTWAFNPKHEWLEDPLGDARGDGRVRRENLVQIFRSTRREDLERDVAHTAIVGKLNAGDPPSEPRCMNGIVQSITDGDGVVVDCLGSQRPLGSVLSMTQLTLAAEECWTRGGNPSALVIGPQSLHDKEYSSLPKKCDPGTMAPTRDWAEYSIVTELGIVDVLPCIFVPTGFALLVDPALAQLVTVPTTSNLKVQATLEIRNAGDGGHALIKNFGPGK